MGAKIFLGAESFSAGRGGIARVARLMVKALGEEVAAGHLDVSCLALSDPEPSNEFGIRTRTAKGSRIRFVYEVNKAALSHTHSVFDFLGMARAQNRIPIFRRPFMVWICGVEVWEKTEPCRIEWARRANTLLSISSYTQGRAERVHGGFARAKVCWLGTETDEPALAVEKTKDSPVVLILSRIDEHEKGFKGHAELIECWPKVLSVVPNARLIVAGSGSGKERIERIAAASPAAKHIEFRGYIPEEQLEALWSEISVFAMPSRSEGFGLVYIEAMRHGVPVIASVHDAAQEINLDGETGYNVDLDKADELPERLIELLSDPDLAVAMGRNGQQRWIRHFTFPAFKGRFLPLLKEFLEIG